VDLIASRKLETAFILLAILIVSMAAAGFGLQSSSIVPSSGSIYYPPEGKILFRDDFESANFAAWNGTSTAVGDNATVVPTGSYEGIYSGCFQTGSVASGTRYAYVFRSLSPAVSEVYARGYFYIVGGLPLDDNGDRFGLIGFEVGGQLQCTLRIHRSNGVDRFGIIGLNGTSSASKDSDAVYPAEGRWYCVEFYIRVHGSIGEYRAWVNGAERISLTNLDTAHYGTGVSSVRFGLTSSINVQHDVNVYCDSVVISTSYVGQVRYTFGIVGSLADEPAIRNFCWLFGNQSISYRVIDASDVTRLEDVDRFDGLVVWTGQGGGYNSSAVREFARTRIVISDVRDFCGVMYPSLNASLLVASTNKVTYLVDWGNFRAGDVADMRNETGNVNQLTVVNASALSSFSNITAIARVDSGKTASFLMNGTQEGSGFYCMDLDATTPDTKWTGIWHVFPAVKMVQDFPTGQYARWMANGQSWWDITWVYSQVDAIVNGNGGFVKKMVIGQSVQGRDIVAMVIGNGSKNAIIDGSIHGCEKTGTFACLRIAELLVQYYHSDSYWRTKLTQYKVIIVPIVNPDGFASNTRFNANGVDLNRQFPPDGTTNEPEAWAVRNLMENYTPTLYVNMHEGSYYYPLHMIYGCYLSGTHLTLTRNALQAANQTFVGLNEYGWFTDNGEHVWVGKVYSIVAGGGAAGMASDYASWAYNTSSTVLETFVWSQTYGARQCLWGLDYYPAVILSFLCNLQR
jgi:hypothetical protein